MKNILTYILLFSSLLLKAQDFKVDVSSKLVGLNETFEITFSLNQSGKNFTPPSFNDFTIIRGPSQSSSTSIINGNITKEISYSYVLKPKKIGVFTILPATIKVRNNTIGTSPVSIQVKKGSPTSSNKKSPYNTVKQNVHLEVTSNKQSCFIGEPVVLTYRLYFNINVGNLVPESITYSKFWTEDIEVDSKTERKNYKGKSYNSAIIKQIVLIPQSTGIQVIDPFSINLVASVPTNRRDFFGLQATKNVDFNAISNQLSIDVKPLPTQGVPNNFSGAVGNFRIEVDLDRDSLDVNESVSLTVSIIGNGNINLIKFPDLTFDNELEVYDPNEIDKIKVDKNGIGGYKKNEYLIVPRYKGIYNLKGISFSYFDPKKSKYISLQSKDLQISVSGSNYNTSSVTQSSIQKEKIDLINEDIKFINTNFRNSFLERRFAGSQLFFILFFVPFVLLIIIILIKYLSANHKYLFKTSHLKEFRSKLRLIQKLLDQKKYSQVQLDLLALLLSYASNTLNISKSNLNIDLIKIKLNKSGVDEELISEYVDLIKYLEMCRYSEKKGDKLNKDLLIKANEIIIKIDTVL